MKILTRNSDTSKARRLARARRTYLKLDGVDDHVVQSTPDHELLTLFRTPLTLVPDLDDDEYEDDIESTRIARITLSGGITELRNVYTGPSFTGFAPSQGLSMHDGDDAA